MRSLTSGQRNINELISRSNRDTLPPTSIQPPRKRRRKKILPNEGSRLTAASIIGIIIGATGHAIITRKT